VLPHSLPPAPWPSIRGSIAEERAFLRNVFERMARAHSQRTRLNGSKSYEYKFWKHLNTFLLSWMHQWSGGAAGQVMSRSKSSMMPRSRRTGARSAVRRCLSASVSPEYLVSEAACLSYIGPSQGVHMEDISCACHSAMGNIMEVETWSTILRTLLRRRLSINRCIVSFSRALCAGAAIHRTLLRRRLSINRCIVSFSRALCAGAAIHRTLLRIDCSSICAPAGGIIPILIELADLERSRAKCCSRASTSRCNARQISA